MLQDVYIELNYKLFPIAENVMIRLVTKNNGQVSYLLRIKLNL